MVEIKEQFNYITINETEFKVSNLGKVYRDGKELRQNVNSDGYLVVYANNNRSIGVHRFVALAFIHNDDPTVKLEVNHLDFNRQNNRVDNLEWLSHGDNVRYSYAKDRYPSRFGKNNSNYGNKKLSKFYKENPEVALEKQSRKGLSNGKSKKVTLYKDGCLIKQFDYIGDCCKYLHKNYDFSSNQETVRCGIRRSISRNVPYRGFTFIK